MMHLNLSVLSTSEQRTRKQWKIFFLTFISFCGICWLIGTIMSVVLSPEELKQDMIRKAGESTADAVLFYLAPAYIFYRCAYQKGGLRFLTFQLCITPPFVIFVAGMLLFQPSILFKMLGIALLLIHSAFYLLCWKLRKINKKLRDNGVYPEEYTRIVDAFPTLPTREELDTVYSSLIQKWPQFEYYSTARYKQVLASLEQNMRDNSI